MFSHSLILLYRGNFFFYLLTKVINCSYPNKDFISLCPQKINGLSTYLSYDGIILCRLILSFYLLLLTVCSFLFIHKKRINGWFLHKKRNVWGEFLCDEQSVLEKIAKSLHVFKMKSRAKKEWKWGQQMQNI